MRGKSKDYDFSGAKSKDFNFRGGKSKAAAGKGKKGHKAKNESYDLIVNIDLQEWRLSHEQVYWSVASLIDEECSFTGPPHTDA